eukprot:1137470-Pelagomonas_calceolata.AAC.5
MLCSQPVCHLEIVPRVQETTKEFEQRPGFALSLFIAIYKQGKAHAVTGKLFFIISWKDFIQ